MTTSCIEFIKGHPKFVKKIHEEVVPSLKSMGTKTCAKEKQTFEEQPSRRLLFHQKVHFLLLLSCLKKAQRLSKNGQHMLSKKRAAKKRHLWMLSTAARPFLCRSVLISFAAEATLLPYFILNNAQEKEGVQESIQLEPRSDT